MKEDEDYEEHFEAMESINDEMALREMEIASIYIMKDKTQQ